MRSLPALLAAPVLAAAAPLAATALPDRAAPPEPPALSFEHEAPPSRALPWELPDARLLPALPDLALSAPDLGGTRTVEAGATVAILDTQVDFADGSPIGRVVDVLVDRGGRPLAVVLDCGGFMGVGNRKVAVGWSVLRFPAGDGDIGSALDPDAVRDAPEYLENRPLTFLTGAPSPPKSPGDKPPEAKPPEASLPEEGPPAPAPPAPAVPPNPTAPP